MNPSPGHPGHFLREVRQMNPVVSIIVPIYNAQVQLNRCIDSVLNQDFEDFELILVNDGSKDASGEICDRYAAEDERIHVIHKENTGVSDSRNCGIDAAKGEYLQFLDSDDWITMDATSLLVRAAKEYQCDLVIADFYRVVGERVSPKGDIQEDKLLSREEFASLMMEKPADFYYGVLWNKLYRREIVEKYHLRMDTDVSWCEDFMFNLEYIRRIQTIYPLRVPVYYYVKTKGSLVSQGMSITNTIKMKKNVFEYYHAFYQDVFGDESHEKSRLQVYRFLFDAAGDGLVPPALLPGSFKLGEERTQVSDEILRGEGFLLEIYRMEKLLDRLLETVALKNDMTLEEVRILLCLSEAGGLCSKKELADMSRMTRTGLSRVVQKLMGKGLFGTEEGAGKKNAKEIKTLPASEIIMNEISAAKRDCYQLMFAGLEREEMEQIYRISSRMQENIQRALK